MSEIFVSGSKEDVVKIATEYRDHLRSELEKVEAFIETSGALEPDELGWGDDLLLPGLFGQSQYLH